MPQPKHDADFDFLTSRSRARPEAGGDSAGWAVSYSDLLMVLLAFFVLYFQFGEKNSAEVLTTIVRKLDGSPTEFSDGGKTAAKTNDTATAAAKHLDAVDLSRSLKAEYPDFFKVEVAKDQRSLLLHFSDHFFRSGQFHLKLSQQKDIDVLLKVISPYRERLALTFIGHTDEAPLQKHSGILDSNLVLSNLRAVRAAQYTIAKGFDPRQVSAQGVGEFQRKARSLSVRIFERGEM